MAIKDPEIGVRAVVKDFDKYLKDIATLTKQTQQANAQMAQASTQSGKATQSLVKGIQGLTEAFSQGGLSGAIKSVVSSLPAMASGFVGIVGPAGAAATAVLGVAVAAKEIVSLGVHGSLISGVEESFSRIAHVAGESADSILLRMHEAAGGLISDFNLMRQANILFAGASGETARTLMDSMDEILEIARVQARATGGEVDYYFNSLVQGIKRAEPRLIDNTGLIIKVGEATSAYAEKLGVSTQELTAEEKTIAILNATLEAGTRSILTYADASDQTRAQLAALNKDMEDGTITAEEYASRLDGIRDSMQNIFADTTAFEAFQQLGVSLQEIKNDVSQALEPLAKGILDFINAIVEPIRDFIDNVAPAFAAVFEVIGSVISGIGNAIGAVVRPLLDFVGGVLRNVAKGIIWVFYSVATGVMYVANTFIFPAVIFILETLASWLEGSSPPPAGPLKNIDKGAQKIMEAWLGGLTGVSLDPVEQVVSEVAGIMGDVAFWNHSQVEAALKALDEALRPFEERLQLVKATFEELKEPIDAAFRSIDRQLETAVKAMLAGDTQAAALVRQLDAQRQALQDYNKAQQESIDNAAIQLAYAKSRQALERQILLIQQSRLGPEEKEAKIKELKAKAAKAGKSPEVSRPTPGMGNLPGSAAQDFGFESDVQSFIDEALGFLGVGDTFASQQALFDTNREKISGLGTRISKAFGNIGEKFAPIVKGFEDVANSISTFWNDKVKPIFDSIGNWLGTEIPKFAESFKSTLSRAWTFVSDNVITPIWNNILKPAFDSIGNWLGTEIPKFAESFKSTLNNAWTFIGDNVVTPIWNNVLKPAFDDIANWLETEIPRAAGNLRSTMDTVFTRIGDNIVTPVWNNVIKPVFDEFAKWLGTNIPDAANDLRDTLNNVFTFVGNNIITPAWNNVIKPALDSLIQWLATEIPWAAGEFKRITEEQFNNVKGAIELAWNTGIKPRLDDLINWLATEIPRAAEGLRTVFENVFNGIVNAIQKGIDKIIEFFGQVSQAGVDANIVIRDRPTPPNTYIVPNRETGTLEAVPYKIPKTYQFRAGGGYAHGGMDYIIGENGPELLRLPPGMHGWIDSNSIFKNKMMMEGILGNTLNTRMPYPVLGGGSNSWQDDHSVNYGDINFNGVPNTSAAYRRFAMLRMMRR